MTLTLFNLLPKRDQAECLKSLGVHLAQRSSGGYTFQLYAIDSFYVVVLGEFTLAAEPIIMKIFDDTEHLEPYLEQIDLHELTDDLFSV